MADITAARLNNLQSRIALILGTGSGTSGYGQTVVSSQVNNTSDIIDADDINNIYTDMVKTRIHHPKALPIEILKLSKKYYFKVKRQLFKK